MNKVPNVIKKWRVINAYRLLPIVILSNNANTYVIGNLINKKTDCYFVAYYFLYIDC